jgi:hypothetical protein
MENYQAKPIKVVVEKWNGGMGQDGIKPGRDSFEWYGLEVYRQHDTYLVTDEFGKRSVLTGAQLTLYYAIL